MSNNNETNNAVRDLWHTCLGLIVLTVGGFAFIIIAIMMLAFLVS